MKRQKKGLPTKGAERLRDDLQNLPDAPPGSHLSDDEFVNYVMEHLSEEEVKRIDRHLAGCESCAAEMERLLEGATSWSGIGGEQRLAGIRRNIQESSLSPKPLWGVYLGKVGRFAAAAVVLLAVLGGGLWVAGPFPQSEADRLAYIQENLPEKLKSVKGGAGSAEQAYNAGISALDGAQKRQWMFFLHYDTSLAAEATWQFEYAYNHTSREFERAEIALYISRAYLMKKNFGGAIHWLEESLAQRATEEELQKAGKVLSGIAGILKKDASRQINPQKRQNAETLLEKIREIARQYDFSLDSDGV